MAISFGNAAAGGLSGAASGATVAGPWGAAAGGIIGALTGLFSGQDPDQVLARFDPETQNTIKSLFQSAAKGNPQGFDPIENRAREQFHSNTIPSLAERFTAMGNQRSGAFQNALAQHGSDFESQLAALRGQYGNQQMQALAPLLEQNYKQNQPGFGESLAAGGAQSLPAILQMLSLNQQQGSSSQFNPSNPLGEQRSSFQNMFQNKPQLQPFQFNMGNRLGGGVV